MDFHCCDGSFAMSTHSVGTILRLACWISEYKISRPLCSWRHQFIKTSRAIPSTRCSTWLKKADNNYPLLVIGKMRFKITILSRFLSNIRLNKFISDWTNTNRGVAISCQLLPCLLFDLDNRQISCKQGISRPIWSLLAPGSSCMVLVVLSLTWVEAHAGSTKFSTRMWYMHAHNDI